MAENITLEEEYAMTILKKLLMENQSKNKILEILKFPNKYSKIS
jgi:hypothetical protein